MKVVISIFFFTFFIKVIAEKNIDNFIIDDNAAKSTKNPMETVINLFKLEAVVIFDADNVLDYQDMPKCHNVTILFYNYITDLSGLNAKTSAYFLVISKSLWILEKFIDYFYTWNNFEFHTLLVVYLPRLEAGSDVWLPFKMCSDRSVIKVLIYYYSKSLRCWRWFSSNLLTRDIVERTAQYDVQDYWSYMDKPLYGYMKICLKVGLEPTTLILRNTTNHTIYSGTDIFYMRTIFKLLNISYNILEVKDNFGQCDATFSSLEIQNNNFLYPINVNQLLIMVPNAKLLDNAVKYIKPFDSSLWIVVITITSIIFLALIIFNRFFNNMYQEEFMNLFEALSILLNVSVSIKSDRKSVNIFFIMLVIYNFFISFAYLPFLYVFMLKPFYQMEIRTLEDIYKTNTKIIASLETKRDMKQHGINVTNLSKNTFIFVNLSNLPTKKKKINILNTNIGFFDNRQMVEFNSELNKIYKAAVSDSNSYHAIEDQLLTTLMCFHVDEGNPLIRRMNQITRRIQEAGLPQIWMKKSLYDFYKYDKSVKKKEIVQENFVDVYSPLTMNELREIFFVWSAGLLISAFVFFAEFVFNLFLTIIKSLNHILATENSLVV